MSALSAFAAIGTSIAAGATPARVAGHYYGYPDTVNVTTSLTTVTAGGLAPLSYAWAQIGESPYAWTITAPTSATTAFTVAALGTGEDATSDFQCIVTDATGAVQKTSTVSAACYNYGSGTL